MLGALRVIDDWIFDTFPAIQKVAWWIEYCTAATHLTQTRLCVLFGSTVYVAKMWYQIQLVEPDRATTMYMAIAGQVIMTMSILVQAQVSETMQRRGSMFQNYLRASVTYMLLRLMYALVALGHLVIVILGVPWWYLVGFGSVFLADYLLACTSLPPGSTFWDRLRQNKHA